MPVEQLFDDAINTLKMGRAFPFIGVLSGLFSLIYEKDQGASLVINDGEYCTGEFSFDATIGGEVINFSCPLYDCPEVYVEKAIHIKDVIINNIISGKLGDYEAKK